MSTNKPDSRETHISRIFGTNKKGERLDKMYADVERMDIAKSATQVPPDNQWQGFVRKLIWCDDPTKEDYNPKGNKNRKTEVLKVCDPENTRDVNDPDEWIPIRIILQVKSTSGNGTGHQDNFLNRVVNEELASGRKVELRRIVHYDTNIDKKAQAAADDSPDLREYVVSSEVYTKNLRSKDKSQYIEQEIPLELKHMGNSLKVNGQGRKTKLLNEYLVEESEAATLKVRGDGDINPPYRLDPFQSIVNIQFGSSLAVLLGRAPTPVDVNGGFVGTSTEFSEDGSEWDSSIFGADTSNAASGFGRTVVCAASEFVAFGKPRDGAACFIAVKGATIQRGVLNSLGELIWSTVATIDANPVAGTRSCKFAGSAFFISYQPSGDDSTNVYLAVSFDGESFSQSINPFPGVDGVASGTGYDPGEKLPSPVIGSVTYDDKAERYVVTGQYNRFYIGTYDLSGETKSFATGDVNFMSAVSTNGLSWTPYFDVSESQGDDGSASDTTIGGPQESQSTVCFGNGVFVAASGFKKRFKSAGLPIWSMNTACAVAVSTNGSSWTNHQLPGSVSSSVQAGNTLAVVFVKSREVINPESKGFFIASGIDGGNDIEPTCRVWRSEDGVSWSEVQTSSNLYGWALSVINKSRGTVIYK